MAETLLRTKFLVPSLRPNLVHRHALFKRLDQGLQSGVSLTLVSAPAGFGKTTLVAHWSRQLAESKAGRLAWFTLDENDNDLGRFFTYFITALKNIDGRIGRSAMDLLHAPQAAPTRVFLIDLLNDLAQVTKAIILTVDDYHLITNPIVHECIAFLLENAPPLFHLLLISRADPPYSLTRLRAHEQMIEIRQDDLRFSQAETVEFLNHYLTQDLPHPAAAALAQRTEGWAAGLQMAAISLQGRSDVDGFISGFTASNRYIFDYLMEEVLALRPPGTRDFLLQTAVLDRLCAPLCDAVLGSEKTADSPTKQLLAQLENANLFLVPLDNDRRWYRYHHLFADLLKKQGAREKPAWADVAYGRASRWFEESGYEEEAIQYALRGKDHERAANLILQYGENWLRNGEIGQILMWTRRLPAGWRFDNPRLLLNYAWALLFRGRENEVPPLLAQLPPEFAAASIEVLILKGNIAAGQGHFVPAIALLEKADATLKTIQPNAAIVTLRGVAVNSLAFSYQIQGDSRLAQQYYEAAITLNQEAGNLFAVMTAMRGLIVLLLEQARMREAESICHNGLQIEKQWAGRMGDPDRRLIAAAPLHALLGRIYYQRNLLSAAEEQLVDEGKLITLINAFDRCYGLTLLAKLRLAQGQVEAVPPLLTQLQEIELKENPLYVRRQQVAALATTRCVLYQQQPTPELRADLKRSLSQLEAAEAESLIHARVLIILDRPHDAVPLLVELTKQTEADGRLGLWLSSALLLCLAYDELEEKALAMSWLRRVVQTAEASGNVRLFLDEGEAVRRPLQELAQRDPAPNYAATILAQFPHDPHSLPSPAINDPLSPREREVLKLIAGGLTNQEIAAALVIAPSTAKRHTVNIYNKLGINNRAEATARAYEMGIVNLS
ncbi:MAG: LuxR C-terminal-related transcriptional regulator [Candidatus Promineifilaceae bacterium]|nr:LuxR C-terminal-related transcriptional regulator [Candidatus Promineifilaceae bacterium]